MWIAHPLVAADRPQMEAFLQQQEERLRPARREWIEAMLMRLAVGSYPEVLKDPVSFGIKISDMSDDLAEYSEVHIAWALASWRKTERWFPKTSELNDRLLSLFCEAKIFRGRARVLLGLEAPKSWETPRPPAEESHPLADDRKAALMAKIQDGPMADHLREMVAKA